MTSESRYSLQLTTSYSVLVPRPATVRCKRVPGLRGPERKRPASKSSVRSRVPVQAPTAAAPVAEAEEAADLDDASDATDLDSDMFASSSEDEGGAESDEEGAVVAPVEDNDTELAGPGGDSGSDMSDDDDVLAEESDVEMDDADYDDVGTKRKRKRAASKKSVRNVFKKAYSLLDDSKKGTAPKRRPPAQPARPTARPSATLSSQPRGIPVDRRPRAPPKHALSPQPAAPLRPPASQKAARPLVQARPTLDVATAQAALASPAPLVMHVRPMVAAARPTAVARPLLIARTETMHGTAGAQSLLGRPLAAFFGTARPVAPLKCK